MRIFSGIQPTGAKHFGNYSGGFRQYAATQERGEGFFCVVDLHSITTDYDPAELRDTSLDLAAMLFATGLDPERSTVFVQSHVPAHAEAAWLLSAVTSYGQLGRMTQFKDKVEGREFISAGLFTYPILMAGDILLYQTDIVPIGDDQRQHLELTRDVAERFNQRFGETFTVPRGVYPEEMPEIFGAAWPQFPEGDFQLIREPIDFLGINYYTRSVTRHDPAAPPVRASAVRQSGGVYTETGWEVYPAGLTETLLWVRERAGDLPLYVTENGAAFPDPEHVANGRVDDPLRIAYYRAAKARLEAFVAGPPEPEVACAPDPVPHCSVCP